METDLVNALREHAEVLAHSGMTFTEALESPSGVNSSYRLLNLLQDYHGGMFLMPGPMFGDCVFVPVHRYLRKKEAGRIVQKSLQDTFGDLDEQRALEVIQKVLSAEMIAKEYNKKVSQVINAVRKVIYDNKGMCENIGNIEGADMEASVSKGLRELAHRNIILAGDINDVERFLDSLCGHLSAIVNNSPEEGFSLHFHPSVPFKTSIV